MHLKALDGIDSKLTIVSGDVLLPGSMDVAMMDVDAVVHCAAPPWREDIKDPEEEIVIPNVDGTKNVLGSIEKAKTVRRIVHISTLLACINHSAQSDARFSERTWNEASSMESGDPWGFAQVAAEHLVHSYVTKDQTGICDAVVLNVGTCLGPCICPSHTMGSPLVVRQLIHGTPQPSYRTAFVDVRDVAAAVLRSLNLENVEAPCRFCICSDAQLEVAALETSLRRLFPKYEFDCHDDVGTMTQLALAAPLVWRAVASDFRRSMHYSSFKIVNSRSKKQLRLEYRTLEETLQDTVESMISTGFVKPRLSY